MWATNSSFCRTTISAAADGVGARRSAAKSAMVTSVSWPTAEITGIGQAAIARATTSSLNAHRSSSEPPPRPDDHHVHVIDAGDEPEGARDLRRGALALHPRRRDDQVRVRIAAAQHADDVAQRRAVDRGDDADAAGQCGQRPLAGLVEQPLGGELLLQLLEGELQRAQALRLHVARRPAGTRPWARRR